MRRHAGMSEGRREGEGRRGAGAGGGGKTVEEVCVSVEAGGLSQSLGSATHGRDD